MPGTRRIRSLPRDRSLDQEGAPLTPVVQAKLVVGPAGDRHEREADAVADDVVRRLQHGSSGEAPVHRQPADAASVRRTGAVVGLQGGAVDRDTSGLIEKARGKGSGLQAGVRRSMEDAFGADFSGVRVHDDAAAHDANVRLTARAFTTGSDVFFGKGAYQPGSASGQRLLAHELTHVVQQGGAPTTQRSVRRTPAGRIQRNVTYGADPKDEVKAADKDLLYGLSFPRVKTLGRMDAAQKTQIRTIDEYNKAVGINDVMKEDRSAMGLYDVRGELASTAAWGFPLNAALDTPATNPSIQLWIQTLRQNKPKIGLEDLGAKAGVFTKNKINKKDRFKKNRKASQATEAKSDRLGPDDTRKFLSHGVAKAAAKAQYDAMPAAKQSALNSWVYRAFFRRTSKLGQDFAIVKLGAKIHFNTVSDPDYDAATRTPGMRGMMDRGLDAQSKDRDNSKNRAITVSEFRHMEKLKKQHGSKFNEYGEA